MIGIRKTKMISIRESKIFVANEEESTKAQEKLFELGCSWFSGDKTPLEIQSRFLFVDKKLILSDCDTLKSFFDNCNYKEIYFEDLMEMKVKDMTNEDKIDLLFKRINIIEEKLK